MVSRLPAAIFAGGTLRGSGNLFTRVLVIDSGDNADLGLWIVGVTFVASSLPFTVATVLPGSAHRWMIRLGR